MSRPRRALRSHEWFSRVDRQGHEHRSNLKAIGLPDHVFDGRPVIGLCNVWSELNPCDMGLRDLAEHAKRGVLEAGGLPLEFPAIGVGEPLMRPSPMMFRNLASMAVEELIRANPLDGVMLLAGCDKTTPALMMGAASCDVPCIVVSSGPKMSAHFRGRQIASGTDIWKYEALVAAGGMTRSEFVASEAAMSRSIGTCMTMGTASTMAAIAEVMGLALTHNCCIPAPDARRQVLARASGAAIVDAVLADRRPSVLLGRTAFENAIRVVGALGGSTNAVLHLLALARRVGIGLTLDDWDALGRGVPCLADLAPSGRFLMDDFYRAGGLPVILDRLARAGLLDLDAPTIDGRTLGVRVEGVSCFDDEVIRPLVRPLVTEGGLIVLRGNLAPDGAVLKPSAASPRLLRHRGRARVFDGVDELRTALNTDTIDFDPSDVLVLRNCGPKGYPGMPEVGNFPLPKKLLAAGVTDMVRISDARMSGTAYGTIVLHVAPEAAVGGPLSRLRDGDTVVLDAVARRLDAEVDAAAWAARSPASPQVPVTPSRGYARMYVDHVLQADHGADFDFLAGSSGAMVPRDSS